MRSNRRRGRSASPPSSPATPPLRRDMDPRIGRCCAPHCDHRSAAGRPAGSVCGRDGDLLGDARMTTIKVGGARGTLATPGPDTTRYGGNTSCVEVRNGSKDSALILDAGSGIRPLGMALPKNLRRIDLLLTHLHLD